MTLVFATHNSNKLYEVQKLLPNGLKILSLDEINCFEEIPETGKTLEENAKLKADYVTRNFGLPCFADDTGLLVDSLNGAPGVLSARYAGGQKSADDNITKLLMNLANKDNREAKFKTVIALNVNNASQIFEGVVEGDITYSKIGKNGFGYDPIFRPKNYSDTFAELPLNIKNEIGHRGKAIRKLVEYLQKIQHGSQRGHK